MRAHVFALKQSLAATLRRRATLCTRKDRDGVRRGSPEVLAEAARLDREIAAKRGEIRVHALLMGQGKPEKREWRQ